MSKKELQKQIPQVLFSGKRKKVFVPQEIVCQETSIVLNSFCKKSGYRWESIAPTPKHRVIQ